MSNNDTHYTLITGGSQGIGRAMAHELAGRGDNIILVALDTPDLPSAKEELRKNHQVDVQSIAVDLTDAQGPYTVFETCQRNKWRVNKLLNNAGLGNSGFMEDKPIEEYRTILALNNRALVELTYYFLPELKSYTKSYLMNTSSMEATLPLPYKAVYTSTKHFIYAFSLALREEVKSTGLSVSVLCPGSVVTNEEGMERIKAHGARAKLIVMFPPQVAKIAIKRMLQGKRVIIPGFMPWFIVKVMSFLPLGLKMKLLEKIFRVYKKDEE